MLSIWIFNSLQNKKASPKEAFFDKVQIQEHNYLSPDIHLSERFLYQYIHSHWQQYQENAVKCFLLTI